MQKFIVLICLVAILQSCKEAQPKNIEPIATESKTSYSFYVGTYTETEGHVDGKAEGIYSLIFEDGMKTMKVIDIIKNIKNPAFLAMNGDYLLAASEIGGRDGDESAYLYTYQNGNEISKQGTKAFGACHVSVSPDGKWRVVTNYSGGVIAYFEGIESKMYFFEGNGSHERQDASHPHSSTWSPDGNFLYVADLGNDLINVIEVDSDSQTFHHNMTKSLKVKSEAGPRHMAASEDGTILYILNELNATITVCERNIVDGTLTIKNSFNMLPENVDLRKSGADIHLHPSGKYIYVSNRVHNSISAFSIGSDFDLNMIGNYSTRGETPRNFAVTKDGKYLLAENQDTGDISVFNILENGTLQFITQHKIPTPVCLVEV